MRLYQRCRSTMSTDSILALAGWAAIRLPVQPTSGPADRARSKTAMPAVMLAAAARTNPIGFSIAAPVKTRGRTGTGTTTVALPMNPNRMIIGMPTIPITAGSITKNSCIAIGMTHASSISAPASTVAYLEDFVFFLNHFFTCYQVIHPDTSLNSWKSPFHPDRNNQVHGVAEDCIPTGASEESGVLPFFQRERSCLSSKGGRGVESRD